MTMIASLRPLLKGSSHVILTLGEENGKLTALIQSKLAKLDEDTSDQQLATLQAALARPLKVTFGEDEDPDVALARLLHGMAEARNGTLDSLTAYREAQDEAKNVAAAAKTKKDTKEKPAAKPSGKGKAAVPTTAAQTEAVGETLPAVATTEVAHEPTPIAVGQSGSIFD